MFIWMRRRGHSDSHGNFEGIAYEAKLAAFDIGPSLETEPRDMYAHTLF